MIAIKNITISYDRDLLVNANINICEGTITAIQGESGCGKTSLLYIIGLIKKVKDVRYVFHNKQIKMDNERVTSDYRKKKIGFVFQDYSLIEHLSIYDNMLLYARISDHKLDRERAQELLSSVSLDKDISQTIVTLSGGEKQRLAIACAIIKSPELLILDEPTNALDEKNRLIIFSILKKLADEGMSILVTTHDEDFSEMCDVIYKFSNKKLVPNKTLSGCYDSLAPKITPLNFDFYFNYIYKYAKSYQYLIVLMILFVGSCISIFLNYTQVGNYFEKAHIDNINNITSREILISSEKDEYGGAAYYASLPIISHDNIELIKNSVYCEAVYNFYQAIAENVLINGKSIGQGYNVQPFVLEDQFKYHLDVDYANSGVYVTKSVFSQWNLKDYVNQKLTIKILMPDNTIETIYNVPIAGVLKSNVINKYNSSGFDIYIPYDLMPKRDSAQAVLAYAKQYNMINLMVEYINEINPQLGVYNEVAQISNLEKSMSSLKELSALIVLMMGGISVGLTTMIYTKYIAGRKKELCLLRVNGLNNKEMVKLLSIEMIIQGISIVVTSLFVDALAFISLSFLFDLNIFLDLFEILYKTIIISFLYVSIPTIISLFLYLRDDPAKILRNN